MGATVYAKSIEHSRRRLWSIEFGFDPQISVRLLLLSL